MDPGGAPVGRLGERPRVLLAEPMLALNRLLKATLGDRFEYFDSFDGDEVLALLPLARPHLLLVELSLPGPDVFGLCQHIREDPRYNQTSIILLTAQADPQLDELPEQVGVDVCIRRPYRPLHLLDTV